MMNKEERDFLLCPMGNYHASVAKAAGLKLTVESGIGYTGVFSEFRVFESYGWMHYVYGLTHQDDGRYYDTVIPNYWEPTDFDYAGPVKKDYFLFVGRLISRKGLRIAVEVTQRLGKRLLVAGQGDLKDVDGMDLRAPHVEYIGYLDKAQRAEVMSNAIALFVPTMYMSPFEGVHVEAMMCGTPVITSDWGVFTETVLPGFNGFRCRTFDEFKHAALAADKLDSAAIKKWSRATFSLDSVWPRYAYYFDRLQELFGKGWYTEHEYDK
jgi:glycosyltransferase involved in cell wall biosynthesis